MRVKSTQNYVGALLFSLAAASLCNHFYQPVDKSNSTIGIQTIQNKEKANAEDFSKASINTSTIKPEPTIQRSMNSNVNGHCLKLPTRIHSSMEKNEDNFQPRKSHACFVIPAHKMHI